MTKELILGPRTEEVKNKIRQKAKKIRFILRSPDGAIYEGENLLQFVQENAGLFDPGDTVRKRAKNSTFRFRESHAAHGLACLNPDRKNPFPRWKGWTWVLNEEQQKRRVELDQIKAEKSKERQEAAMLLRSEGIKKSWTPERKDKLRQEMLARWQDPEYATKTRQSLSLNSGKLSEIQKEVWQNPEVRKKRIESLRRPELRKARSLQEKKRWSENREQIVAAMVTPEFREKSRQKAKKQWSDPTYREEHTQRLREKLSQARHTEGWKKKWRESIKKSPKAQAAMAITIKQNKERMAIPFSFKSPKNVVYEGKNVTQFVEDNKHLFDPEDVVRRKTDNENRASKGLLSLNPNRKKPIGSWKGWTWVSITERLEKCVELDRDKIQETKQ